MTNWKSIICIFLSLILILTTNISYIEDGLDYGVNEVSIVFHDIDSPKQNILYLPIPNNSIEDYEQMFKGYNITQLDSNQTYLVIYKMGGSSLNFVEEFMDGSTLIFSYDDPLGGTPYYMRTKYNISGAIAIESRNSHYNAEGEINCISELFLFAEFRNSNSAYINIISLGSECSKS